MKEVKFSDIQNNKELNYDNWVEQKKKLNKLFIKYYDDEINKQELVKYVIPYLIQINNHFSIKFYKAFRNNCWKKYKLNGQSIIDHQYWGLDNTFKIFYKCINNFDFDRVNIKKYELNNKKRIKVEESRFVNYFQMWLNSEFSNQLKKAKKGRFDKENNFIKVEEISMNNNNAKSYLNKFNAMFNEIDKNGEIELDDLTRNYIDEILTNPTDSAIFGYMLNKYYFNQTYCNADIARFVKLTTRQVKYRKKLIKDSFINYINNINSTTI